MNKLKYFHYVMKMSNKVWPNITQKKIGDDTFICLIDKGLDYGYIQYYISFEEEIVNLLYIYVHPELRGRKYGEYLMRQMLKDVTEKMKDKGIEVFEVHLDDMSDHFSKENNLYRKMGFEYCEIDEDGPCGPEMSLTITILS